MTSKTSSARPSSIPPLAPAREPGSAVLGGARPNSPSLPGERPAARAPSPHQRRVPATEGTPSPDPGAGLLTPAPGRGTASQAPSPMTSAVGRQETGQADPGGRGRLHPAGGGVDADAAPSAGQSQYAAARAKALAAQARRRPSDPQQTPRHADPRARVAEMMAPCACSHPELNHWETERGRVTWCSIATAAGPCGCQSYQRAPGGPDAA